MRERPRTDAQGFLLVCDRCDRYGIEIDAEWVESLEMSLCALCRENETVECAAVGCETVLWKDDEEPVKSVGGARVCEEHAPYEETEYLVSWRHKRQSGPFAEYEDAKAVYDSFGGWRSGARIHVRTLLVSEWEELL